MTIKCGVAVYVSALLAACYVPMAAGKGGVCSIRDDPLPECTSGFVHHTDAGKCVKPFRHQPHYYCAEQGYVVEGNQCVLYQYADGTSFCRDPHTTLSGTMHHRGDLPSRLQVPLRLPADSRRAHRHVCIITQTHPADFSCPFGCDPSGDKCVAKHFAERRHSCPDGFEFKRGIELPPVLGVGPHEETCIRGDHGPVQHRCARGRPHWIDNKPVCCITCGSGHWGGQLCRQ
ncbi:unnamed protein product [Vitrella brassicaformis CCMP3155]|uniref:Chitin-binding type-2 domain-containing protein n=1 Tax=Vitrella brassicaformis (strain CCMP3155) TaxID=1169540 RepID=A0A0G4EI28_VITBC|nr:unnamed protein product [Vitrella brassicaformis CCMP3155]|eukprot:CEL95626.1 unnamed protein product [Vitrella brassicaformis CCMP3155]